MLGNKYDKFIPKLTKRELEVIEAVLSGALRYKSIAFALNISVNTVKTHLRKIYQIVEVNNIEALTALFHGYSPSRVEITPKPPQKVKKSPQIGDRNQHFFTVIMYNIIHFGGKKMRILKDSKVRIGAIISLVSVIALVISFIAIRTVSGSRQANVDYGMTAESVPEGIRVTFSDFLNIPPEIDLLTIAFVEEVGIEEPEWENNNSFAIMNYISQIPVSQNWEKGIYPSILEQVRQTGTVTFPFVQSGHKYNITAVFSSNTLPVPENIIKTLETECVADGGIYLDKNITLKMNNASTGVTLSDKPAFTSDVLYEKIQYSILIHKGDYTVSTGTYTDNLFWDFEPWFSEHLIEEGVAKGNYPAVVVANLHIVHNNISWLIPIDISPVFNYSL